ncbi:MAG: hypothetical protein WCK58_13035, partial [Chloroflexota bacterium]
WEIRRRRAFSLVSFAAAVVLFAVLVAMGAPQVMRALVLFPIWGGFFSWLQARRRFCAGYAVAGRSNFADGHEGLAPVTDPAAHNADMRAVARMTRDSLLLSILPTVALVLLPF